MDANEYAITPIDFENIDSIRALWEELNASHAALSPYFSGHFNAMTFEKRKAEFREKTEKGELRTDVCVHIATGETVGYCVNNIVSGKGEIDSLFVKIEHRGRDAGSKLVESAIAWMRSRNARDITVNVAVGNEGALNFYRQFGLFPKLIFLSLPQ
jgi:ribosomal protein S18 acetylase RimI-like enzyme